MIHGFNELRLFRKSKMGLEIYPEDGSIIIATGLTDQIFTHLTFTDGKVSELYLFQVIVFCFESCYIS